ncbi:MAG: DUF1934 family protein [Bacillota bacterium]
MENIKIKISSLVDGVPWLFYGDGTKREMENRIILDAVEYIGEDKVLHNIEFSDDCVKITRIAQNKTYLEFNKKRRGYVSVGTEMGDFSGKIITHTFGVKKTKTATYISLAYNTDFDSENASHKKIQISFSEI